jgi:peptidoglycan/LPS O-acetylase OafA/YrhL
MYFKGLNGLRFFAAILVVITHVESIRKKLGFFNFSDYSLFQTGGLAVQFFFVLSGFLITYLLLQKDKNTQKISLKSFYFRRVLRIFPLYYLLAIIGLYILPYIILPFFKTPFQAEFDLFTGSVLYLFFLPNLANSWFSTNHLYPLWSIGVEEQFYIIWAPVMKYFKKYFIAICLSIVALKIIGLYFLNQNYAHEWFTKFFATLQFECMAIGGLGAWWIFFKDDKKLSTHFLFQRSIQIIVLTLLASLVFFKTNILQSVNDVSEIWKFIFNPITYPIISSLLFLHLILNVSLNEKSLLRTENKVLNFLGQISYGLYMYHILVVYTVIKITGKTLSGFSPILFSAILYTLIISLLVSVCYLSYRFFEKPILKLK